MEPRERLIFALDTPEAGEALAWVGRLRDRVGFFKVGLELFVAAGPDLVREIVRLGQRVFLDLKLHDIPATVKGALNSAESLGAELITVHVQAGQAWEEAVKPRRNLKLLGVTALTSLSAQDLLTLGLAETDPAALVSRRAVLAAKAGLSGVVCSGQEAALARAALGPRGLVVCPGIRPAWSLVKGDDQARITTPAQARKLGADMIVVGRPIRDAADPAAAADRVADELARADRA